MTARKRRVSLKKKSDDVCKLVLFEISLVAYILEYLVNWLDLAGGILIEDASAGSDH